MLIRGNKGFAVSEPLGRIKNIFNILVECISAEPIHDSLGRIKLIGAEIAEGNLRAFRKDKKYL